MDQHLGIPLSDDAYQFLTQKYDTRSNGMFNYRLFTEALESGTKKWFCSHWDTGPDMNLYVGCFELSLCNIPTMQCDQLTIYYGM